MSFGRVYPLYIAKVVRKGKTKAEVDEVITWLTGYSMKDIQKVIEKDSDFEAFFKKAPKLNPNRFLIKGTICGVRVEDIKDPVIQGVRYMDKLVDEVSKGRPLGKDFKKIK